MYAKKIVLLSIILLILGCNKKDLNKPHEYIKALAFGDDWKLLSQNKVKFYLSPKVMTLYFDLGTGDCEKYLKKLDSEIVYKHIWATNNLIKTEEDAIYDKPYRYVFMYCVAFHGKDQNCEEERLKDLANIAESNKEEAIVKDLTTFLSCDIRKPIGKPRAFDLAESKSWRTHE